MKRLIFCLSVLLLLTACNTPNVAFPTRTPLVNLKPELLIGPDVVVTPTRWLSPLSATAKAKHEAFLNRAPLLSTPMPTPTMAYHMPTNIYSPTPGPKTSVGITSSSGSSAGCRIKGNVSKRNSDQKIYHCPGWRDYDRTDVNPSEGDRWFCSEAEAIEAGFRRPQNENSPCY